MPNFELSLIKKVICTQEYNIPYKLVGYKT